MEEGEEVDIRALARKKYETYLSQKRAHDELQRLGLANDNARDESHPSSSSGRVGGSVNHDILTELTMKITERFLKERGKGSNSHNNSGFAQSGSSNVNDKTAFEQRIMTEIENCTCPICYELMVPPANMPMIIFPCGHTFCKQCLMPRNVTEKLVKCPICRQKFQSHAPNIHLQNIICAYTDTKQLVESKQSASSSSSSSPPATTKQPSAAVTASEYSDQLNLFEIRCKILEQEKAAIEAHKKKVVDDLSTHSAVVQQLSKQKSAIVVKLEQMQKELTLIEDFIEENQQTVSENQRLLQEDNTKIHMLDQTLAPLLQERKKYQILSQSSQ